MNPPGAAAGATEVAGNVFEATGAGADFFFELALNGGFGGSVFFVHEAGNDFALPRIDACHHRADSELFNEDEFAAFGVVRQGSNDGAARPTQAFTFDWLAHATAIAFVSDGVATHTEEAAIGFGVVFDAVAIIHAVSQ